MNTLLDSRRKTLLLFLLVLSVFPLFALTDDFASAAEKNFLWEAKNGAGTVYLLGSIHFMKRDAYPLNRRIEEAFEKAKVLAVEADISDTANMDIFKLASSAMYTGGDALDKHISRETLDLLKKEMAGTGMPFELMLLQKPWFIALTLQSLTLMNAGFDPSYGIDSYFLSKSGEKEIAQLESIDYQINLFSGLSDSEQEALLLSTLKEQKTMAGQVEEIVRAWKTGDARTVERIALKDMTSDSRMSSLYEKFYSERNRNMASKVEDFLRRGQQVFVIVGAAHLVGDEGIIAILKKKGYPVRQL